MPSTNPILIVAGGSRGIGAAAARLAGERGYDVAVNYLQDREAAGAVVAVIKQSGRRAIAVVWHRHHYHSPMAERFLAELRQWAKGLEKQARAE